MIGEAIVHRGGAPAQDASAAAVDPVVAEVIRHGLNSAAGQMKRALVRTAFSPIIYEVLDFAVALYDDQVRLLAQAPSLPMFMGRLSFCVEAAVAAVGGAAALEPGDVVLYNDPYGTGSHPQDAAVVAPAFLDGELVGYAAIKAHWLDVGGKEPYSTDTVDLFQEGTIFPGVKLVRRGELVDDVYRMILSNSRVPQLVAGDVNAELVGVATGVKALLAVVRQHALPTFRAAVERIFDHGEAVVRSYFERLPDGVYRACGQLDDDGVSADPVTFEIAVTVDGSDLTVDFSNAPEQRPGPVNCTLPKTVAISRVAVGMLAGAGEPPNEGHQRPIQVITRPGTLFHPQRPAPSFIGGWASFQALETVLLAVGRALPDAVPAGSGGDICSLVWWGERADGRPWADGSPHPVGQGAHAGGDGASALMHISESATRVTPAEVWETKNPWLLERTELIPDSGGAGRRRGGLGVHYRVRALEDMWLTAVIERTRSAPSALAGGGEGRSNRARLELPDGMRRPLAKATRVRVPAGAVLDLQTGGGGGHGPAAERPPAAVRADLREGYVTERRAREDYPHAF
ncbi:hydantoinase B/oxoprolinase family protein [Candidatus Solirubrobacter pratensis]|uniref:hydantoinase B/oxoprolinase family protein n=1 Tax=Candidatus Solirubrobacter pratensis TaxID=1298857 RepID=UPI00041EA958|nr:hydantoinase B/oxoprolinase family protein [Candidatus Solirubrobacter pratensis]